MADISKLKVNETTYNIKDSTARSGLENKVEEAPFDGAEYVRKNGSWALSSGAGGAGATSAIYFYNQTVNVANNAEILRITDSSITPYIVVLECTFANPSYITSDVTWTSYNGYISFTGTCTAATTANVTLGILADGKVSKSGDTMTNTLVISKYGESRIQLKNTEVSEGTTPASMIWVGTLGFLDNNNNVMGYIGNNYDTSDSSVSRILARRRVNGTTYDNFLDLAVLSTGSPYVGIPNSAKTAWRNALGLGDSDWQSLTNSSEFSGTIFYRKVRDVIYISGWIALTSNLSAKSLRTIATLPSGYRPSKLTIGTCYIDSTSISNRTASIIVYTSGDIEIRSNDAITNSYNIALYVNGI